MDAAAVMRKFSGNNPQLPVDRIAAVALDIEHHSAGALIDLLIPVRDARVAA